MRVIDLNLLANGQEIPKIQYRPIKSLKDRIYLEQTGESLEDEWTQGIFRYDLITGILERVDQGPQVDNPYTYRMEVPGSYEDVLAMDEMDTIFFSIRQDLADDNADENKETQLTFYEMNTIRDRQQPILSYSFSKEKYEYGGMEVFSQDFLVFSIRPLEEDPLTVPQDRSFLVEVKEKKLYEIKDKTFLLSSGNRMIIGEDKKYIFLEETYLSEDEELDLMFSDDVELLLEIPEEVPQDQREGFFYTNSIKVLSLDAFVRLVKAGSHYMKYTVLDTMKEEGLLRVVGYTASKIYYKKKIHHHILKSSRELTDRLKMGKEEIYVIDKNTLEIAPLMELEEDNVLAFEGDQVYKIRDDKDKIIIEGELAQGHFYEYEKSKDPSLREYFFDIFAGRFVVAGVIDMRDTQMEGYLKIIDMMGEEEDRYCQYLFIIGDTLFLQ